MREFFTLSILVLALALPISAFENKHELRCGLYNIGGWPLPLCCTIEVATGEVADCVPMMPWER